MKSFRHYLEEANIKHLTHLEHLEEAILQLGFQGARESIEILRSIRNTLQGNSTNVNNVSLKWDGSPAIIFGKDPEDGQFFVGTKGVFSKSKKLVKTQEDLDRFGYQGELKNKLNTALKHFPKLQPEKVYQGDMMFTSTDLQRDTIDGEKFITFTPNTITYAVSENSDLAKEILKAKIGIVIHTEYVGEGTLDNLTATPGQVDISPLADTPDVWIDDPYVKDLSGKVTFTQKESQEVSRSLSNAGKVFRKLDQKSMQNLFDHFDKLPKSAVGIRLQTFINQLIKNDRLPEPGKGKDFAREYERYMYDYWENKVIAKVKKDETKQKKREFFNEWIKGVDYDTIANIIDFMAYINEAKIKVLSKLSQGVESINTFLFTGNGYEVTSGEGFVISDKMSGNVYKIVDRLSFSKANFS